MRKITKPLIAIVTKGRKEEQPFSVPEAYLDAVSFIGGEPILIPSVMSEPELLLKYADGLIVPGGGDADPNLYDGSFHPHVYGVDPERDRVEIKSIQFAITQGLPSLFICRGMHIAVVAFGGKLIPHLPDVSGKQDKHTSEIRHRLDLPTNKWHPTEHQVQISTANSRLAKIIQKNEISQVVSCHHQAVKTIPSNWRAVAFAPDGVIEAVEHIHHPWAIGVQWHPELSIQDDASQRLFQGFIDKIQA